MWIAVALVLSLAAEAQTVRMVPFEQQGKWGYRTPGGKVAIAPRYEMAQDFSPEGIAAVVDEHGWAYIDRRGKLVIRPLVVDNGPDSFAEGLARFRSDGKIGFFDSHGRVAIQPHYAFAASFSEGYAAVCNDCREVAEGEHRVVKGGTWGFIDRTGATAIPLHFEAAESFQGGKARVQLDGKWRYIDTKGALEGDSVASAKVAGNSLPDAGLKGVPSPRSYSEAASVRAGLSAHPL